MKRCKYIADYISDLRSGKTPACREMLLACDYIEQKLADPEVIIRTDMTERAIELMEKYFNIKLFPWEKFVTALVHCFYQDDTLVFSEFLIMMGRGNGKNGFISCLAWYLTTPDHGISGYNVDIIANSEDQAKTSFEDVYNMLEDDAARMQRHYHWTKVEIVAKRTRSYIKYNTSNARTKDGKRSACLIFDELHEYENSDSIKVFRSGFGKKKHCRIFEITTNGYVRDGVLDDKLRIAEDVLNGVITESRLCPLLFKLDTREEANDPKLWEKACPSLPYMPTLRLQIEQEMIDKDYDQTVAQDLYTKRFNLPTADTDLAVTDYENIKRTNRPLPELRGWSCICGIDYAELSDWAAVNLHFKKGEERIDIGHAWICAQSKTLSRVKAPWRTWAENGYVTVVDDVGIHPDLLCGWIWEKMQTYNVQKVALDGYRYALVSDSLAKIGFDAKDRKNVKLVRPSDIMQIEPVIQECFNRDFFTWGDYPPLRWAVNNTKRVRSSRKIGSDTGNFIYAKIEAKSRKTDMFMALVAAMTCENELSTRTPVSVPPVGAISF